MSTALERREELLLVAARDYGIGGARKGKTGGKLCVEEEISKMRFLEF